MTYSIQSISFLMGVLGHLAIFVMWHRVGSPDKFAGELSYWMDTNMLKGGAKKSSSKRARYARFFREILFAARWSAVSVAKHFLFAIGFGCAIFLLTLFVIQPFVPLDAGQPYWEKLRVTAQLLALGLADALSFGLFEVFGIELKPRFPEMEARFLIFIFYALTGVVVLRAAVLVVWEIWTVILALIFPEPMTRLANELDKGKKIDSRFRRTLAVLTTLGNES